MQILQNVIYFGDLIMIIQISDCNWINISDDISQKSNYWCSKLAYSTMTDVSFTSSNCWQVCEQDSEIHIDLKRHIFYLPLNVEDKERCYALRVLIDTVLLLSGCLPFHAAALRRNAKSSMIFAETGAGKSRISSLICHKDADIRIIGDDHIYLLDDRIQGNAVRRIRHANGQDIFYENSCHAYGKSSVGFCYFPSETELSCKKLVQSEWMTVLDKSSAMKYALSEFVVQGRKYRADELFACDTAEIYEKLVKKTFSSLFKVIGTHEYAAECINKYLLQQKGISI